MTNTLKSSLAHWPEVSEASFVPHTAEDYERLVALLDELVDEVGNDETHRFASLMEVIGLLVEKFEDEHVPDLDTTAQLRENPPNRGE